MAVQYPFVQPLEKSLAPSLPKASTFYLGQSPTYGMHVFVNLQHSPKPWETGMFTVNVVVACKYGLPETWQGWGDAYERFDEAVYRLAVVTGSKDLWWCLQPREDGAAWGGGASRDLWEPSSYDDEETVLSECSSSVRNFLAQRLLEKGGFLGKHAV